MAGSIKTETETVIKKILPYLRRRGYEPEVDIDFETAVKTPERFTRGYVDLLVTCGKAKPLFLIEAKKSSKRLTAKDRDQALAYGRSSAVRVPFVVVTNGTEIQCYNTHTGAPIRWNGKLTEKIPTRDQLRTVIATLKATSGAIDVPLGNDESLPFRPGLPLKQLNALFARCHNAIRKIEKDEEHAFADFSKLLFLKLLEEKADRTDFALPYSYRFHELAARPESESDQVKGAVLQMIATIKKRTPYGDVLEDEVHLNKPKTFRYIVDQLSSVSFEDSSLDTKGAAFEYFVRATLKGKRLGQYFTPRPLVELMSALVGRERIVNSLAAGTDLKVFDPACGTGGFLVYLMKEGLSILEQRLASKKILKKTHDELAEKIMKRVFFGSDANEAVACAAKMNMIIAGDGHTNIQAEDSLAATASNWSALKPDCDLILTNPPFGTSETDSLTDKELNAFPIRSTKGQNLFLQRMVLATVPGGEICTVIDEGMLNTESAGDLRGWLMTKCHILATVRLPDETFKPNKINVRSSVLYMRRRECDDVDLEDSYRVRFYDVESLGYVGSGEPQRGFDFARLVNEVGENIVREAGGHAGGYGWSVFDVDALEIAKDPTYRLDCKYWSPKLLESIADLTRRGGTTLAKLNIIKTGRGKSPPAELYVDEDDGYALVVKAGSNISKLGRLIVGGDYVEKNIFEEQNEAHILKRGDVILASTGEGTLGKCCVYDAQIPALADGHVTIVRTDRRVVDPYYLADYLRCGFGALQIERLFTGSTGLIELTPDHVDAIVVDLLSGLQEQKKASRELRKAEAIYERRMDAAGAGLRGARKKLLDGP